MAPFAVTPWIDAVGHRYGLPSIDRSGGSRYLLRQ